MCVCILFCVRATVSDLVTFVVIINYNKLKKLTRTYGKRVYTAY